MKANYLIGDMVRLTNDAIENYEGTDEDTVLTIEAISFNTDDHPGFDEGCGSPLYCFSGFLCSLYEFEMIYVS